MNELLQKLAEQCRCSLGGVEVQANGRLHCRPKTMAEACADLARALALIEKAEHKLSGVK